MFLQTEPRPRNPLMSQFAIMSGVVLSNRPLENLNCILQPSSGMGALYLGDVVSTLKDNVLEMNRVKAILTCMAQNHHLNGKNVTHKVIPIKDTLEYPIHIHFNQAAEWIQEKRRQGINVLVHCHAGVSRSATIVTAYLMRYKGWTALEALNYVRSRRQRAKPNANFWNQLNQYELTLKTTKVEQSINDSRLLNESKLTQNNVSEGESPTRQYRRRKIFETPPIPENHYIRQKNVISTECLPPSHHYTDRHSQSIMFNTPNRSQIHENKSAVQNRTMNHSIIISQSRILTPQWQPHTTSPQMTHLHYNPHNYAYKQTIVSPFQLGNLNIQ